VLLLLDLRRFQKRQLRARRGIQGAHVTWGKSVPFWLLGYALVPLALLSDPHQPWKAGGWDSAGCYDQPWGIGRLSQGQLLSMRCLGASCILEEDPGMGRQGQRVEMTGLCVSHSWCDSWPLLYSCGTLDKCLFLPEFQSSHL
jgi:hypothetical protein